MGRWKLLLVILLSLCWHLAEAKVYFQYNAGYSSETDAAEGAVVTSMRHLAFLGGTFGKDDRFAIGQSVMSWSSELKGSTSLTNRTLSVLELGPRLIWYLNDAKTVNLSGAWHPYVSGDRTPVSGTAETVSGSAFLGSISYELKISKQFYMGASIVYHSMTITEAQVDTTTTTVSEAYSSIIPTLEMSYRFK